MKKGMKGKTTVERASHEGMEHKMPAKAPKAKMMPKKGYKDKPF